MFQSADPSESVDLKIDFVNLRGKKVDLKGFGHPQF